MAAKKVLITENIAEQGIEILRNKGYDVDVRTGLSREGLIDAVGPYDALIVRSATKVDADVIAAAENLKIIGRAGVTVDNIDIEAATERNVIVCNAPTSNIISTAEYTMALLLACARDIVGAHTSMHDGEWEHGEHVGFELYGKTLAIFGLGRIGGLVAERARAFGMNLIGYDPYCSPERAESLGVELVDDVDAACAAADFITVHLPKTEETIGMFGPKQYALMKDGVIVVNTARGGIFDVESLADFMAAGKIAAAGVDVFEEEPCTDSPLHEFPNAVLTPHIAAVTREAQIRAGSEIAEFVWAGLEGSIVPTAINTAPLPPEVLDIVGPYVPACQMIGRMLAQIIGGIPKTLTVEVAGALSGTDPAILTAGALEGLLTYRKEGRVKPGNVESVAHRHGIRTDFKRVADAGEYASYVRIIADGCEAGATLYGTNHQSRIISLLGYKIDIAPAKSGLVFEYVDAPGRIGVIGTILGDNGVNITTMQIGANPEQDTALVFINVEGTVTEAVLAELSQAIDLKSMWCFSL